MTLHIHVFGIHNLQPFFSVPSDSLCPQCRLRARFSELYLSRKPETSGVNVLLSKITKMLHLFFKHRVSQNVLRQWQNQRMDFPHPQPSVSTKRACFLFWFSALYHYLLFFFFGKRLNTISTHDVLGPGNVLPQEMPNSDDVRVDGYLSQKPII